MPCRDYELDNNWDKIDELRSQCDKLARIACKALTHIEESADGLEILILKDPEIEQWWKEHKEADRLAREKKEREEAEKREKKRLQDLRKQLLNRLTPDEKKALGLK